MKLAFLAVSILFDSIFFISFICADPFRAAQVSEIIISPVFINAYSFKGASLCSFNRIKISIFAFYQ
jgi:hypothetical protein